MIARGAAAFEFFQQRININVVNYLIYKANRMILVDPIFQTLWKQFDLVGGVVLKDYL